MKHLNEATLQTYIDGELSPANSKEAKRHLASCADCAALLEEIRDEAMQVCALLNSETNAPVPSARLRQRLDASIAQLEAQPDFHAPGAFADERSLLNRLGDLLSVVFAAPSRAAFAGLAVAVAVAAIFVALQRSHDTENTARVKSPAPANANHDTFPDWNYALAPKNEPDVIAPVGPSEQKSVSRVPPISHVRINQGEVAQRELSAVRTIRERQEARVADALLPGEGSYLNAIASLTDVLESNPDEALSPSLRAEYERNLAVVDQAITATRATAKRNPNDPEAAQFLFSAYQSKLELQNAVADQSDIAQR